LSLPSRLALCQYSFLTRMMPFRTLEDGESASHLGIEYQASLTIIMSS
jgi:hypothetical protein